MSPFQEHQCFSVGTCVHCNYMTPIDVGVDARMHDCVEYECPNCGKQTSVVISIRGVEPGLFRGLRRSQIDVVKGRIRAMDPPLSE